MVDGLDGTILRGTTYSMTGLLHKGWSFPQAPYSQAATGVKKRSRGQGLFLVLVKQSRINFKLGNSGQDVYVLHVRISHNVVVKCVRSNSQGPVRGAVRWSNNKNDSQIFLTL